MVVYVCVCPTIVGIVTTYVDKYGHVGHGGQTPPYALLCVPRYVVAASTFAVVQSSGIYRRLGKSTADTRFPLVA